jgi:hypothetical protein
MPGNEVILFGASAYTVEVARAASEYGILSAVVLPVEMPARLEDLLPPATVFERSSIAALRGAPVFEGLDIETPDGRRHVRGDALVVDGDWVLERQWRDQLRVKWDLERNRTAVPAAYGEEARDESEEETAARGAGFTVVGDAFEPSADFFRQYERGRAAARNIADRIAVR